MAISDKFDDRAALVDAVYDHMLTRAASSFPVGLAFTPQDLADALGVKYNAGKPGYGPSFESAFEQDWGQLVRSCASWLAAENFLLEWQSTERAFANTYRLSERGARLMGCLPACLDKQPVEMHPGDENL